MLDVNHLGDCEDFNLNFGTNICIPLMILFLIKCHMESMSGKCSQIEKSMCDKKLISPG